MAKKMTRHVCSPCPSPASSTSFSACAVRVFVSAADAYSLYYNGVLYPWASGSMLGGGAVGEYFVSATCVRAAASSASEGMHIIWRSA
jgi:hypothetical protein